MADTLQYSNLAEASTPKWMLWTGRIITGLLGVFFSLGLVFNLMNPAMVKEGMAKQGFPDNVAMPLAIVELVCALLYLFPRTTVLGAILLTGYLGGATAIHVRAGENKEMFIPVFVGVLVWLGVFFRDARVRALTPWRSY